MQTVWLQRQEEQMLYSTATFRRLLDCAARPGKIRNLAAPQFSGEPPKYYSEAAQVELSVNFFALGMLLTLLDSETSFAVIANGKQQENSAPAVEWIALRSGAKTAEPGQANFVLVSDGTSGGLLTRLNPGTLLEPENSATAIYAVERLANEVTDRPAELVLELSGPGICDTQRLCVTGLAQPELELIKATRCAYPTGVDVFLVDAAGRCAGLPRSTKIRQV
jgi:alpha-D-ribose 1-methylphosphonate 5-triphosphate synthase subunit PhnH